MVRKSKSSRSTSKEARLKGAATKSSFSHFDNIRSEVQEMIDRLYELHDETDPRNGLLSEEDKHEKAQRAVAIWWYVYARLMQWVQSHFIGYEMARSEGNIADVVRDLRGAEISDDVHQFEQLGTLYVANPGYIYSKGDRDNVQPDHWSDLVSKKLSKANADLTDEVLRRVIVQLLLSTSADSSVWRFPLSHGLRALNHGETSEFLTPARGRRRGRPYLLDEVRAAVVAHVHYLMGKGIKKHIALAKIGDQIGASPETIRDWEKKLRSDDWFFFHWESAFIAGQIEDDPELAKSGYFDVRYFGTTSTVEMARHFLNGVTEARTLDVLKKRLRKLQSGDSGGGAAT